VLHILSRTDHESHYDEHNGRRSHHADGPPLTNKPQETSVTGLKSDSPPNVGLCPICFIAVRNLVQNSGYVLVAVVEE